MTRVSYSQINVWNQCNYKWYMSYKKRWKPIKQPSYFALGGAIHVHLNNYYRYLITNPGDVRGGIAAARAAMEEHMPTVLVPEMVQHATAWKFFELYVLNWASVKDRNFRFTSSEQEYVIECVSVEGRPFELIVIIDLESVNNGIWIWDHKSFSKSSSDLSNVTLNQQLSLYGYAKMHLGVDITGVIINGINTYDYKDRASVEIEKLYKRVPVLRTKLELQNSFDELRLAVDDLEEKNEREIFRRNINPYTCKGCAFFDVCSLDIKGRPIDGILEMNFQQKEETPIEEDILTNGTAPDS